MPARSLDPRPRSAAALPRPDRPHGVPHPADAGGRAPTRRGRRRAGFVGLVGLLLAFVAPVVVAGPYVVEHTSMTPTLAPGEIMLVDRVTPRIAGYARGDLVVFQPPDGAGLFVKRIVGLPGEEVTIARGGVYVNGHLATEPYLCGKAPSKRPQVMRIPDDTYLVLGDNRTDSLDSRSFGPVPSDMMIGRVWAGYRIDGDLALFVPGSIEPDRDCAQA